MAKNTNSTTIMKEDGSLHRGTEVAEPYDGNFIVDLGAAIMTCGLSTLLKPSSDSSEATIKAPNGERHTGKRV